MRGNDGSARLDDDALLARLGMTLAVMDPAPPSVRKTGRDLLSWRTVDAELADLLTGASTADALEAGGRA